MRASLWLSFLAGLVIFDIRISWYVIAPKIKKTFGKLDTTNQNT